MTSAVKRGIVRMATNPTRQQQQACNHFAEALYLITQGARLDGRGSLDAVHLTDIAELITQASSAFNIDEIVARALEWRVTALELPRNMADLLTLLDTGIKPLEMLLIDDGEFRALVERLQEELGEV
jgi:hypothetical protein